MTRTRLCLRLGVLAAVLAGGVLAACAQAPAAGPAAPEFQIATDKPDDVVTATIDGERLLVDVQSASGIGSAGVRAADGEMPPAVLLRFHLRGLEQMTFAFGGAIVKLSVPSGGDRPVMQSVVEGGQDRPITPESPYWMEVTQGGWLGGQRLRGRFAAGLLRLAHSQFHHWLDRFLPLIPTRRR